MYQVIHVEETLVGSGLTKLYPYTATLKRPGRETGTFPVLILVNRHFLSGYPGYLGYKKPTKTV